MAAITKNFRELYDWLKTYRTDYLEWCKDYARCHVCPLVHVQPHGRLGDLDKLNEEVSLLIKENMFSRDDARDLLETIADAPTVIPASEEG